MRDEECKRRPPAFKAIRARRSSDRCRRRHGLETRPLIHLLNMPSIARVESGADEEIMLLRDEMPQFVLSHAVISAVVRGICDQP